MDNQRLFIWAALALVLWVNYVTWQKDYAPPPVPAPTAGQTGSDTETPALEPARDEVPALPEETQATPATSAPEAAGPSLPVAAMADERQISVRTDVLDLTVDTRGGQLSRADLLKYPRKKDEPNVPVRLFNDAGDALFVARSGLRSTDQQPQPTHLASFSAAASAYRLEDGQDVLRVPLSWTEDGFAVTKTYVLRRGSYAIDVEYEVRNGSAAPWPLASYVQLVRHYEHISRSMFNVETYAYRGPAVYDGDRYLKLDVEDEEDSAYRGSFAGGWMAAMQHHFVAAAVPPTGETYHYTLKVEHNDFVLSYIGPVTSIEPGGSGRFRETIFVGPKLQDQLETVGPKLELTADYGKLTIIAQPLFWLLEKVHGFVGNWGWAIIIVTFLIKLVFYKLTETSGRSMAKMRNLTPRIKHIQETYKDDREKLGRAMMELYKREKINPLAGCLPIVIQIPVFLAFYWVLLESVEMRQAPFLGWINDLSSRDPYFILPIIMGVAMFGQFKLNPTPPDPVQAKVFAFMPIVMTGMMAWFPAGLVLYWITNTVLSIAQQWNINRVVAEQSKSG